MNYFTRMGLALALLLLSGCSFIDGVSIELRNDSFEALKMEVMPFLLSKGFKPDAPLNSFNESFSLKADSIEGLQCCLIANFSSDGKRHFFFVGKVNANKFSADEVRLMDECAAFLADHAQMIVAGSASKNGTSAKARENFYAKIKKVSQD